jgi:PKD repeat protein
MRRLTHLTLCLALAVLVAACDSNGPSNEAPTADFSAEMDGLTVNFTNESTDPDGSIASFEWTFGDGESSTEENPSHTYDAADTYTVELTVTDAAGATASTMEEVTVSPTATTFNVTIENVGPASPIYKSGAFAQPVGATENGPIAPGDSYRISFSIAPNTVPMSGARFSFATMFIQSNDLYYAFGPNGLPLFDDNGNPVTGDVTDQVSLYDAGTEVNEEPGTGPNQAPRQSGADTGDDEDGTIRSISEVNDGFDYPAVEDVIQVTVENQNTTDFTITITNVSEGTTVPVGGAQDEQVAIPLSPGAYAVHAASAMFHNAGGEASEGIEDIAEDGMPDVLTTTLGDITTIPVPLSPGAYAVHSDAVQLYTEGEAASEGIEDIAEDGVPTALADALDGADGVSASGAFGDGPIGPTPDDNNNSYSFTIDATPGDRLSFATMYVQSNDLYYGFAPEGLALFDEMGNPVDGDVTADVMLFDAGTEGDQEPGVGLDQAIRQSGPDTGPMGEGSVMVVDGENDGYTYPPVADIIRVTITPQ